MATAAQQSERQHAQGIGASVPRKEDQRFLTGRGRFVADIAAASAAWCHFLRSPYAHARVLRIETKNAAAVPGVFAILTGADMAADGIGPMTCLWRPQSSDGRPMTEPPRWALARERVRYVGEAVALVIADTAEAAADAAEQIAIEYEILPAITTAPAARQPGALRLHDEAAGNVCLQVARGNSAAVDTAFRHAPHAVHLELVIPRLAGAAIEPRALIAQWHADAKAPDGGRLALHATTQVPHHVRRQVAEELGIAEASVRVVAPDMGGGFGYKGKHYPEETALAWAARRTQRTLRWTASRSESFLCDLQARDHVTQASLAVDAEGRFLALRVATMANIGAYVSNFGASIPGTVYASLLAGPYATPAIAVEVTCVFTNTVPTDAYRGAGRPEACLVLEQLADRAAAQLGLDRAEIRRRNFISPSAMPYRTPLGPVYDCGDFPRIFERALVAGGYTSFEERRRLAPAMDRVRGIGLAMFVESSGIGPSKPSAAMGARTGFFESASIRVDASGRITAMLGTHNHGQGHETTFAQVLADRLGVAISEISIVEGDTDIVPLGTGTFGSRSIAVGGAALALAADKIIAKASLVAAHLLEAACVDVAFSHGQFSIPGTDRSISFAAVAHAANSAGLLPAGIEPGLDELAVFDPPNVAWSNGCHLAEVEVDTTTGAISVRRYVAIDDFGTVINPLIVHGQVHGGIAQGSGAALCEQVQVEQNSGQVLSGSFLDYALPRAGDLPGIDTETDESQPFPHNPLGAKGCGESGAVGAPAAILSAVLDALRPLGVTQLEIPLTAARVWQAIREASGALKSD